MSYAQERYDASTGATERLDYYDAPAQYTSPHKPAQLPIQAVLAIGLVALVLAVVMRLGAVQEAQQPYPRDLPGWAQSGYYDHSFNNSFNDNSWHWDFCAGYCPR
jgi:hypothetical protein